MFRKEKSNNNNATVYACHVATNRSLQGVAADESQTVGLPPRSGARCEWSRTSTPSEAAIGAFVALMYRIAKDSRMLHSSLTEVSSGRRVIEDRLRESHRDLTESR